MADYVMIGNSVASVAAVEAIRRLDTEGRVTIIGDEPYHAYSRPLIPEYLAGIEPVERLSYRDPSWYEEMKAETILGERAVSIDPSSREVSLESGRSVSYDRLLVATGASAARLPIPGLDREGVFHFITRGDVEAISRRIEEKGVTSAVTIGAGLIGLKAAEILALMGIESTVVELMPRVLPTVMDTNGARIYEKLLSKRGVRIILGESVKEILEGDRGVSGVRLAGGDELECGLVISAAGVSPRIDLVEPLGVEMGRGVRPNGRQETGLDGIYVAGDLAETRDPVTGEFRPLPIWPKAFKEGTVAGTNMAGGNAEYTGIHPMNAIEFGGLPFVSAGSAASAETDGFECLFDMDTASGYYKKMVLAEGRLAGMILVGDAVDRAGVYTGLVSRAHDCSAFKDRLLSRDFGIADTDPGYREILAEGGGGPLGVRGV